MRNRLTYILVGILIFTVLLAAGGVVYNWATSPNKELVFVKYLLSISLAAFLALLADIIRNHFFVSKTTKLNAAFASDVLGIAIVHTAQDRTEVDRDLQAVLDYVNDYLSDGAVYDPNLIEDFKSGAPNYVAKYKGFKFGGPGTITTPKETK